MNEGRLPGISLAQLSAFLLRNGWQQKAGKKRLMFSVGEAYESPSEISYRIFERQKVDRKGSIRIVIPTKDDETADSRYLTEALRTLTGVYGKDIAGLVSEIQGIGFDSLIGVHPKSSVSLSKAHEILTHLKNLVAQAANAEEDPQPYFPDAHGNQVIDQIYFGHTIVGSFGFRVECPILGDENQLLIGQSANRPMKRRILERLAFGFLSLEQSDGSGDIALIRDNFWRGFNANICDALLDLSAAEDNEPFTVKFSWSTFFPVDPELDGRDLSFKLTGRVCSVIKSASEAMKALVTPAPALLVGTVVALASDIPPMQLGLLAHRKITLQIAGGEYARLKMQLDVSDSDYQVALSAHTQGRSVQVHGQPKQLGRHWRIEDYRDFAIV